MSDASYVDLALLKRWIGRTEVVSDVASLRLARELAATFDWDGPELTEGDAAALGIHWCLAPYAARTSELGHDGHSARGGFLPPVPLPRRMWAGSDLHFKDRLYVGDVVERRSRIADVTVKSGQTGILCFVAIDHEFSTERGVAITERQNIVYRTLGENTRPPVATPPPLPPAPTKELARHRDAKVNPVLLFRYSALTFNGHRIHYDRGYAVSEEGYPGLIVHGPLQATLLLEYAASIQGKQPAEFKFRGLQPLFDYMPFRIYAKESGGGINLWIENGAAERSMEAWARW
jgi:3-methylfumaryl-CoA hydratase